MMIVNLVNQKRNQGRGNKMMRKIKIAIYKVYYTAGLHHYRYYRYYSCMVYHKIIAHMYIYVRAILIKITKYQIFFL